MKVFSVIDGLHLYGKERANLNVCHILQENGYSVTVLYNVLAKDTILNELNQFNSLAIPFPRRIYGSCLILKYIKAYFLTIIKVRNLLKKEKPDYLLIPTEIALAYLYLALFDSKVKVVFRCGDSPIVSRKKGFVKFIYGHFWKTIFVKRVDKLVCNALFIHNQIVQSGRIENDKDSIIYNYPPAREYLIDGVTYLEKDESLRVGYMGRIVHDKGVYELCQAVINANNNGFPITLYIAGNPLLNPKYTEKCQSLILQNHNLSNRIIFLGNVNNIDLFYDNVDIACIPSIYPEPMANIVMEAKSHKKLCVIFNQGGMPEIITHKKNGYICEEITVNSLQSALIYYAQNRQEVERQGLEAYNSIIELGLTKDLFTERWLKVFC